MNNQEKWSLDITEMIIDLNQRLHSVEIEASILRALVVHLAKEAGIKEDRFMEMTSEAAKVAIEIEAKMDNADEEASKIMANIFTNQGDRNVH